MDGLWILLLAAFGIASAVMKRLEKSSSSGDRPPSNELKRYLDTVGDMMKEVESAFDDSEEKVTPPQKVRRRIAQTEETPRAQRPRVSETPRVSAQFEQTVKIPPMQEEQGRTIKAPKLSQKRMREAVIWSEILQPPVSKRKK